MASSGNAISAEVDKIILLARLKALEEKDEILTEVRKAQEVYIKGLEECCRKLEASCQELMVLTRGMGKKTQDMAACVSECLSGADVAKEQARQAYADGAKETRQLIAEKYPDLDLSFLGQA